MGRAVLPTQEWRWHANGTYPDGEGAGARGDAAPENFDRIDDINAFSFCGALVSYLLCVSTVQARSSTRVSRSDLPLYPCDPSISPCDLPVSPRDLPVLLCALSVAHACSPDDSSGAALGRGPQAPPHRAHAATANARRAVRPAAMLETLCPW